MCLLAEPQSLQQCGCLNQTCRVTTPADTPVEISDISQAPLPEGELEIWCEYGAHVLKTFINFNEHCRRSWGGISGSKALPSDLHDPCKSPGQPCTPVPSALGQCTPVTSALGRCTPVPSALGRCIAVSSALGQFTPCPQHWVGAHWNFSTGSVHKLCPQLALLS